MSPLLTRIAITLGVAVVTFVAAVTIMDCGTSLSATSDAKLVATERFAAFELKDCAVDAGTCKAGQIRELANGILCAAASVRADGKKGPVDAGATCAVTP